ncbi:MAG: hypothetical protein ABFS34_02005 [Gemmatimonadota bacterium]
MSDLWFPVALLVAGAILYWVTWPIARALAARRGPRPSFNLRPSENTRAQWREVAWSSAALIATMAAILVLLETAQALGWVVPGGAG